MSTNDSQKERHDISLTKIYEAITKQRSLTTSRCLQELETASTKQIDYTLRKILSYSKHEHAQWPPKRLIRCLEYIYIHRIKHKSDEMLSLSSLKACVRWSLNILAIREIRNPETIQATLKFICCLLETDVSAALLEMIRHHGGVQSLLYWVQSATLPMQLYSVRALTAHVQRFAKDIIQLDGYTMLTQSLSNIPDLLVTLSFTPPVTDAAQRRKELDQCVMICRLLDSVMKTDSALDVACADTQDVFPRLARIWGSACSCYCQSTKLKNLKYLVYSLTSIVQHCTSSSKPAALYVGTASLRKQWQPLLALSIHRWVSGTCCYTDSPPSSSPLLEQDKSIVVKLLQISIHALPEQESDFIQRMLWDVSNFIMAFLSQPILPEQAAVIGTPLLIHQNVRVDVEERGYRVSEDLLNEHQALFVLSLECMIRHVQLASSEFTRSIAGHVAWCLKSLLTILLNVSSSSLVSRAVKLVVFFLHYDESIDILAASSTNISSFVWSPTIEMAKQGLLTAVTLSLDAELTPAESNSIYKSKRAFVALQKITNHPRACERLVDCNVFQLVDIALIPEAGVMGKTPSLYALFGQFVAALSRRTAFVRTRLRDECGLFPMMMKMLQEAIEARQASDRVGWNRLIASCLGVVRAFQYDEASMRLWLSWNQVSVLPSVLNILFPWRHSAGIDMETDAEVTLLAAQVLDQLSSIPSLGRQMIADKDAMSDLSKLFLFAHANTAKDVPPKQDAGKNEKGPEEPDTEFKDCLKKSAIRIFSSHENVQYVVLGDTFTKFFRPLVEHAEEFKCWRLEICKELFDKKANDYWSLFEFTKVGEQATRLHEFTAVALAYLALGVPDSWVWNQFLGLSDLPNDVVARDSMISVLCQMLVYGLEYDAEDEPEQALLALTPMRRHAAAQAIRALALRCQETWQQVTRSLSMTDLSRVEIEDPSDRVRFVTDDAAPGTTISASRQLLGARSPIFYALLSDTYAESELNTISLHDVTFHGLAYFVTTLHQLNQGSTVLDESTSWNDMIELLQTSDRFGAEDVRNLCEEWILEKLKRQNDHLHDCLEGAIRLFRQCRDPIEEYGGMTSKTWPFATILMECLKFITLNMLQASQTKEFSNMVEEGNVEELNSFCDGLARLLRV